MKLFKKSIALITAVSVSVVALLSGCGSTAETSAEPSQTEAVTETAAETTASTDYTGTISPLLFKVEGKKGNTMYLFGTIHVGDSRNDQIVDSLSDELQSCDAIALEFDSVAYAQNLEEQMTVISQMVLTDGTTIKDHLSSDNYEKCVTYMTDAGTYNSMYDAYCPGFWYMLLSQTAVQKSDLSADYGIDDKLANKAYDNGKEILEFESAQFQMDMFKGFSDELVDLLMESFFETEADYNSDLNELYNAWTVGDEEKLIELLEGEDIDEDDEDLTPEQQKLVEDYQKTMTYDRNKAMGEKAVSYLDSGKNVFVAVGTAHVVGETGLAKQLADKGYKVKKIEI